MDNAKRKNMIGYIALTLLAVLAFSDFMACRRILRSSLGKLNKVITLSVIISSSLFIFVAPMFMYISKEGNDNGAMTKDIMTVITLFILFAAMKFTLYIYWLPSSNRKLLYAGLISSGLVSLFYLYSVFVTRTDYRVNEVEVRFENLPHGFDGYRVAFISDIHLGTMYNTVKELSRLADVIESVDADILMFGGDLVNMNHEEITPEVLRILSRMRLKEPTLAVLGNHDTGTYMFDSTACPMDVNIGEIRKKVVSAGWTLLMDSTVYLYNGTDSIAVTGIDYNKRLLEHKHSLKRLYGYNSDYIYFNVDNEVFNITISHLPQLWNELSRKRYSDLTLSGHIHAMQFKLNVFGYRFSPARFMYDEWSGMYENEDGKLYINDGIGNVGFFARIGARPEITVITLRKE